jgi:hypothetical protein
MKPGAHGNDDKNIIIVSNDKENSWDCAGTLDHVFVLTDDVLMLYSSDGTPIERKSANSVSNETLDWNKQILITTKLK